MSDDEVEKFEITDHDLENEFNINRPRGRLSKNQQIYGVWADGSSDEENGGRRGTFFAKKSKNYSAPIGFVAGGVQQAGKKKEEREDEEEEEEDDEGVQRRPPASSSESEEEKQDFGIGEMAGFRKKRTPLDKTLIQKGVGGWEKHTKGIGAKLLLQMGYEPGKGLGKSLQGIHAPIVAKLRKGRGAIGAYGPEEAAKIAEVKTEDKKKKEKSSRWRKDDDSVNKRVRYFYKTIEDVIEQGQGMPGASITNNALSKVKVIDMTGPEQRILSGYHAISRQQRPATEWELRKETKTSNFALPELQHNLKLLVDLCEQDIISNDHKYKCSTDRIVALQHESTQLEVVCKAEEEEILKIIHLISAIDAIVEDSSSGRLELTKTAAALRDIKVNYPKEYVTYNLSELAVTLIMPLVKKIMDAWQPLKAPEANFKVFVEWRDLLECKATVKMSTLAAPEAWGKLLWHAWVPCVRTAINDWSCRKPEPLLRLIEVWKELLPEWLLQYILENLILPRVVLHVHEWDPLSDTVPIHSWIHPWLPFLHTHLQTVVFPMIRQALSGALNAWHPSDRSARLMLLPWDGVFTKGEMSAFLIRNIYPKLQVAMDELVINPQHQVLDQHWKWVMDWADLLPIPSLSTLLAKHFFPKWLQVLSVWLNHCPNYDQVSTWYLGWKALFSENLLKQVEIKENFRQGLELINRSVGVTGTQGALESVSYLKTLERESAASSAAQSRLQSMSEAVRMGTQSAVVGFKAIFAKRCEEKDIVFVPVANKLYEGKQVYRCGSVLVYLDRSVVFVSQNNGNTWHPQSVSTVLMMAEK